MAHRFYPGRDDGNLVDAIVVGYLDFEPAKRRVLRLRLVSNGATCGRGTLDVAVRSVPGPPVVPYAGGRSTSTSPGSLASGGGSERSGIIASEGSRSSGWPSSQYPPSMRSSLLSSLETRETLPLEFTMSAGIS